MEKFRPSRGVRKLLSTHISWTYIVLSWAIDTSRKANLQQELAATVIRGSQLRYSPLNIVLADSRNLSAEFIPLCKLFVLICVDQGRLKGLNILPEFG